MLFFRKFRANTVDPYNRAVNLFYDQSSFIVPGVFQNYQHTSSYNLDYIAEVSDLLSQADIQTSQMYKNSNWRGSRAAAVMSTVVCGLDQITMNVERPSGFLRSQFPSVIGIPNASQKYLESVRVIENHQLLTGKDQAEFCELALRIAVECQYSSDEELAAVAEDILSSCSKDSI